MTVSGWCFGPAAQPVQCIRLRTDRLCFTGITGLTRPDVKAGLPDAPDDCTGFEIHALLPPGRSTVSVEARLADGSWHILFTSAVKVRRRWLPLWLDGGWTELLHCQVPGRMKYLPRTLPAEKFPPPSAQVRLPELTIVTPSYQQARFLPETLCSVLGQKGVSGQYFVQDGASTDGSPEIIRYQAEQAQKAADSEVWLTAWESSADHGQADAIIRAFAKSSGGPDDLMAWINSDDFYLPGSLAFVADYFARHPEVDAIYGHRLLVDESSREIGRWFLPKHDNEVVRLYDFVPQETLFWRRRIWEKVGGLDASFRFAMDWDLLLRFQAAGAHIVRVPYFLASFRVHPAQKTSAQMQTVGQREIDALRTRTFGRAIPPAEIENNPRLRGYLRRSAFVELLWSFGLRV